MRSMPHLEGRQSVIAALQAGVRRFDVIFLRHGMHEEKLRDLLELAERRGVPVQRIDGKQLDAMTHAATHGGVVAVVSPKPRTSPRELLAMLDTLSEPPLLLLIEGIDDARNLGFVLRTAEAMGVHAVLVKKHLWDFDETEVSRPSSGAYERLPLVQIDTTEPLIAMQKRGIKLYGAVPGAKRTMYDVDLSASAIIALGGEKRGLSGAVRDICDRFITIPTRGGATSLSLSHASAIVLAEALRQRTAGERGA
jgi:23S rRNA (guanosine2251-2'-O)-methyltransferase